MAPNAFQRHIISITRRLPDTWAGKRLAFALRRCALIGQRQAIDIEVFSQKMRVQSFGNVCEKRILFTPQFFDPIEREHIAGAMVEDFVFIDIGANVGAYSLFVAGKAMTGCTILAVEPQPEIFDRLTTNIEFNPDCGIKAIPCAIAGADGEVTLFLNPKNLGEASIMANTAGEPSGSSVTVPAKSLLSLASSENIEHIDAIKLDVEGAEDIILVAFFSSAPRHLWPGLIILETGSADWQTDCVQLCIDNGYTKVVETRMNVILKYDHIRKAVLK